MNGLYEDVQKSVQTSSNFDQFMSFVIEKVEKDNLDCISIYCTAGRHRSVTCAELLKKHVYKNGMIIHIELNKITK